MSKTIREWYRFENAAADPTLAEIHILDDIGGWDEDWIARNWGYDMGVTARAFVEELAKLPEAVTRINVHINSRGGDVMGGINIANALREQQLSKGRTVTTIVDGIAASIASVVAMAGQTVKIADNGLMMIHNPYAREVGNAAALRKTADVLDAMRDQIVATYRWHSQQSPEDLAALMDAETWLDADGAIAAGLATEKVTGLKAAATFDPKGSLAVPEAYRARVEAFLRKDPSPAAAAKPDGDAPKAASGLEVARACRECGCPELTEELLAAGATLDQVTARLSAATAAKTAAAAREQAIRTLCVNAKAGELAAGYIAGGMTVDQVKAHLTVITAKLDRVEIDGTLGADPQRVADGWKSAFARAQSGGIRRAAK